MLLGDVSHELQLFLGENGARGVAGVGEHDGAGLFVDAGLNALADGEFVAFLGLGGDGTHGCTRQGDEGGVVGVEWLGNDDLVAVFKNAGKGDLQSLGAAGGDEHLLVVYGCADLVVVIHNSVDHYGNAVGGCVGQNGLGEVLDSLKVCGGSLNIGLADVQMIDLFACLDGLVGVGSELSHGGETALFDLAGEFHVCTSFLLCARADS